MGYAFAQVTPRGDRNFENHTISVVYAIDQGPRTYVERIEIRGNERTRDFVVRREFDISEGDAFNQVLVQRAKRRLEALDFFTSVEISTAPGSQPDQVILVIDLVEKSTGEFSIGAGYTTGGETDGPNVEGVDHRTQLPRSRPVHPFLGGRRQERTRLHVCRSPSPISSGGASRPGSTSIASRAPTTITRAMSPAARSVSACRSRSRCRRRSPTTCRRKNTNTTTIASRDGVLDPSKCNVSLAIQQGVDTSPWIKSSVSGALIYNTIDDINNPHSGFYGQVYLEGAGLGGDAQFVKATARGRYYHTLSEEWISSAC